MRIKRLSAVTAFLILSLFFSVARGIRADEPGAAVVDQSLIDVTTQQYFTSLEEYRNREQQFFIARESYYQLNTLAAQDEAIRRGKDLLSTFSDVLTTYFTYLHLTLLQTQGIQVADKESALNAIAGVLGETAVFKDSLATVASRADVDQRFTGLNESRLVLLSSAYEGLQLIKIGQLQTAINTASVLRIDMVTLVNQADLSSADRAIKLRGLGEVEQLLMSAQSNLDPLLEKHREFSEDDSASQQTYREFQLSSDPVYVQLRQADNFMKEIAKGL